MKFKFQKNFYRSFRFWISLLLFIPVLMHYSHGFESTADIFWASLFLVPAFTACYQNYSYRKRIADIRYNQIVELKKSKDENLWLALK